MSEFHSHMGWRCDPHAPWPGHRRARFLGSLATFVLSWLLIAAFVLWRVQ